MAVRGVVERDASGGTPSAAVVVATRDRADRLAALLDSVAAQRGVDFEVVVVDDGSRDGTAELLRGAIARLDLRALRLEHPRGPGGARNVGWRAARAPLIAFVDDDCVAEPGWLAALVERHRERPHALVQGRTVPDPGERHKLSAWSRTQHVERLGPYFQTCNIAYPRALLDQLAGFDETFAATGEDTDLACRAREAGFDALFAPDAVVRHAVHALTPLDLVRGSQRWADTVGLVKRHPHLRDEYFTHRVFWKPSHERLLTALVGLGMTRRTLGLSLALAAPYLRLHRGMHGSWAGTVARLPAHVAVDSAEIVAMVRGSLRFGTIAL